METNTENIVVSTDTNTRIDLYLAGKFDTYSRSYFQQLIKKQRVLVNGHGCLSSHKVKSGDAITIQFLKDNSFLEPEKIVLDIIHKDADIMIVNKPAGMVVHPAAGNPSGTLANALAGYHIFDKKYLKKADVFRPGIVHRLDKDTSGIMIIARNDTAHIALSRQFARHTIEKTYLALVHGRLEHTPVIIDVPLGRDPIHRQKMCVRSGGKQAETYVSVIDTAGDYSMLRLQPKTGRTHQIRVHLAYIGHPVAGDSVYGRPAAHCAQSAHRHMLHAWHVRFTHPRTKKTVLYKAPIPADMTAMWRGLGGKKFS
jgi:23S rRNA pseudouridine1911/1915/1917 synthase